MRSSFRHGQNARCVLLTRFERQTTWLVCICQGRGGPIRVWFSEELQCRPSSLFPNANSNVSFPLIFRVLWEGKVTTDVPSVLVRHQNSNRGEKSSQGRPYPPRSPKTLVQGICSWAQTSYSFRNLFRPLHHKFGSQRKIGAIRKCEPFFTRMFSLMREKKWIRAFTKGHSFHSSHTAD